MSYIWHLIAVLLTVILTADRSINNNRKYR